jgi:hypothetical protein
MPLRHGPVAIDPGMPAHRVQAHLRPVPTPEQSRHTIRAMDDALPRLPREGPLKRCLKDERTPINSEDKGEAYLSSEGCLVIFGGSTASECKRMWEFTTREVKWPSPQGRRRRHFLDAQRSYSPLMRRTVPTMLLSRATSTPSSVQSLARHA